MTTPSEPPALTLLGERGPTPRGPLCTALLLVSLIAPALRLAEVMSRWLLGYRRPLTLALADGGLSAEQRTLLLGRVLSESQWWIPRENLARISREVRYSRVSLYAGLLALAAGSYVGFRWLVIGASLPHASLPLMAKGLLALALAIGFDFALSVARHSRGGRCCIVVVPRKGRPFSFTGVDRAQADAALAAIAARYASG